jgi:hypothetical protein
LAFFLIAIISLACGGLSKSIPTDRLVASSNSENNTEAASATTVSDNDETPGEITEKIKPAAGKGNVQGKVLYNDKPAADIEVTLCEKFSTSLGIDCKGKTVKTKTDKDGVFVLANVEPMEYQGLMVKVFTSNIYVYPRSGVMQAKSFTVSPDKTTFAANINLFKGDLKITAPKSESKVAANDIELKWNAYPDAEYYKISLFPENPTITTSLSGKRVDGVSYKVDIPLMSGKYRLKVEAFNANDRKLAESSGDIKFTVATGEEPSTSTTKHEIQFKTIY